MTAAAMLKEIEERRARTEPMLEELRKMYEITPPSSKPPDWEDCIHVACMEKPADLEPFFNSLVGFVNHHYSGKRIVKVCHGKFEDGWAIFARLGSN